MARSRAVVTGYYAGFNGPQGWCELTPGAGPSLRDLFTAAATLPAATPHFAEIVAAIARELGPSPLAAGPVNPSPPAPLPEWGEGSERTALVFSASKNRYSLWHQAPETVLQAGCAWPALELIRWLGVGGPALSPVAACATGAHALAVGAQLIEDGYAEVVYAGAAEVEIPPLVLAAYRTLGALSKSGIMRPFDRRRDGFVPAEGAACVRLENEGMARRRGAAIYGVLSGWSLRADATGATVMDAAGDSIAHAIDDALRRSGGASLDYINAHGTATRLNDVTETRAILRACGNGVPVSATKPLTGHLLGAGGAVEAVLCLRAMAEGYLPPTLNLEEPDPECSLDTIPLVGRPAAINRALSLSFGFGGHIGALVFEK